MARKHKRRTDKLPPLPGVELVGPTPEQMAQAHYDEGFVNHVDTNTKAKAYRRRTKSALEELRDNGAISDVQLFSAQQIAKVAEKIERAVGVACASLEARVDNASGDRDALIETIHAARLEKAYTLWRTRIPMPRRMLIDMVTEDQRLFATARKYGVGWPKAKRQLRTALDLWVGIYTQVVQAMDQDDLNRAHARIFGEEQIRACA